MEFPFPEVGDVNGDQSDIDDTGETTSEENGDGVSTTKLYGWDAAIHGLRKRH